MRTIDQTITASSAIIVTDNLLSDVSKHFVWVNENQIFTATTTSIYYQVLEDTELRGRALFKILNLNSGTCYVFSATTFTDPGIEFWKYDFEPAASDLSLQGGEWENSFNVSALATSTSDLILTGGEFMAPYNDFAPEELLPGHTTDSLGINVYTQSGETYATVFQGTFPVYAGTTATYQISNFNNSPAGYLLSVNNVIFQRSTSTLFTTSNQYYISGKSVTLPPQTVGGIGNYSYVTIGGIGLMDENSIYVNNTVTSRTVIETLVAYDDVKYVYVLDNGQDVQALTTSSSNNYGYMLGKNYDSLLPKDDWNRASIQFYNLPEGPHFLSAWVFNTPDVKFNKIKEDYFVVSSGTQAFSLATLLTSWQPFSDKVIVEKGSNSNSTIRTRLTPPNVSNYFVTENNRIFNFFDNNYTPVGPYDPSHIIVYANGTLIRSGYDYDYDFINFKIATKPFLYPNGTYISIVNLKREPGNLYDYVINDNIIRFEPSPLSSTSTVKVMSFSNHDNLFMETETYDWTDTMRYTFIRPVIDSNYLWVYLNGLPLTNGIDFVLLQDLRTIELSYNLPHPPNSRIMITSIKRPDIPQKVYGYRYFSDFYDRTSYKRLSKYHTTYLTELLGANDTSIFVAEETRLSPTNNAKNIPGVILIDRERIEFFGRTDNSLFQLRRGTGGTGPAPWSDINSKVIDQGVLQTIPMASDITYTFNTLSTTSTNYTIFSYNTQTGNGFTLNSDVDSSGNLLIPFQDQVKVFFGGKPLLKTQRYVYETVTTTNLILDPPEFVFHTSSQIISLNTQSLKFKNGIEPGISILITHKKGRIWTGTESILTSNVRQAKFIRAKEAELPDVYFYGGDPRLLDENYLPITSSSTNIASYDIEEIIRIE